MDDPLVTIVALSLLGWSLMWADYGLTLLMARPVHAAGLHYELHPFLRADVAAQRKYSPRFVLGTSLLLVALLVLGWLAVAEGDGFVFSAVLAGLIATRLHLVGLHLHNGWQRLQARARPVPTIRQAMVRVAVQQARLAALFTLLAAANPLPALQAVWIGAAAGFLLMASTTLLWRWREGRFPVSLRAARALFAR